MRKPTPFNSDARELANRLFAAATGILEDAAEIAMAGQDPRLTGAGC